MMHRFPFIVIEGVDGTGKTTLRKSLFRLWQGLYGVTPLCVLTTNYLDHKVAADLVDGKYSPTQANRDRYLAALIADKRATIRQLIEPALRRRPVIADRWLLSELTFFYAKHHQPPSVTYAALADGLSLSADVTFVLDAAVNESMARTGTRKGDSVRADWDIRDVQLSLKGIYEHVVEAADEYPLLGSVVHIDAGAERPIVLQRAWEHLLDLDLVPELETVS
jgi:dTMP kinase